MEIEVESPPLTPKNLDFTSPSPITEIPADTPYNKNSITSVLSDKTNLYETPCTSRTSNDTNSTLSLTSTSSFDSIQSYIIIIIIRPYKPINLFSSPRFSSPSHSSMNSLFSPCSSSFNIPTPEFCRTSPLEAHILSPIPLPLPDLQDEPEIQRTIV